MNYKQITDDQLTTMLANATETYYCAGGHSKAAINKIRVKECKQEMQTRGLSIPHLDKLLKIGIFNGYGSV